MKKIISLIVLTLILVVCAFGLSACENKSNNKDSTNSTGQTTTDNNTNNSEGNNNMQQTLGLSYYLCEDNTYSVKGTSEAKNKTNIVIPSTYNNKPVTSIGSCAFHDCTSLSSIVIPNSITSIEYGAFWNCTSLSSIEIGSGVTSIGEMAFDNCASLSSIVIPDSVTSIGEFVFRNCTSLSSVEIGSGLTIIEGHAFDDCTSLSSIEIGSGVTNIEGCAFYKCTSLRSVKMGDSVTIIEDHAFYNCESLSSVEIPNGVTSIEWGAFEGCYRLVEVINNSSLTIETGSEDNGYVGYYALNIKTDGESDIVNKKDYLFYTCDGANYLLGYVGTETNLILPNDYNGKSYQICKYAFYKCKSLSNIDIGCGVTSIGKEAFSICTSLSSVTFSNTVGWKSGSTTISSEDLQNTSIAAIYLHNTYDYYAWTRNDS